MGWVGFNVFGGRSSEFKYLKHVRTRLSRTSKCIFIKCEAEQVWGNVSGAGRVLLGRDRWSR